MILPDSGLSAAKAGPPIEKVASAVGEEGNSAFWNVLRFLSRPGFALRSAISGDFEGAFRNLGQMALDLPTGGFVNRDLNLASIANVFLPEPYELPEELTTREQRPEFTDVLDRWGVADRKSWSWLGRLGVDIAGGMVTDPLTFLTGSVGGVGKGVLQSTDDVAKNVAKAAGREVATRATPKLTVPSQEILVEALRQSPKGSSLLDDTAKEIALTRGLNLKSAAAERALEKTAAEEVFRRFGTADYSSLDDGLRALEKANLIPTKGGMYLKVPLTKIRSEGPIATNVWGKIGKYGTAPGWAMSGLRRTNPTLAAGIEAGAKGLLDTVKSKFFSKAAMNESVLGPLPRQAAERVNVETNAALTEGARDLLKAFGKFEGEEKILDELGEAALYAEDSFTAAAKFDKVVGALGDMGKGLAPGQRFPLSKFRTWGPLKNFVKDVADGIPGAEDELLKAKKLVDAIRKGPRKQEAQNLIRDYDGSFDWLGTGFRPDRNGNLLQGRGRLAELLDEVRTHRRTLDAGGMSRAARKQTQGALRLALKDLEAQSEWFTQYHGWEKGVRELQAPAIARVRLNETANALAKRINPENPLDPRAFTQAQEEAKKIWKILDARRARMADDYVKVGLWPHAEFVNPFHMSHQTTALFSKLLQEGLIDKGFHKTMFKGRAHLTNSQFRDALMEIAKKHGVDVPEALVQETNLMKLSVQQLQAHEKAMAFHKLKNELIKLGMPRDALSGPKDAVHPLAEYLRHQFKAMPERGASKILGGGKFEFKLDALKNQNLRTALKDWVDPQRYPKDGRYISRTFDEATNTVVMRWPGLNYFYKPLLTVVAPAFHIRNTVGAMFMGLTDPDLGINVKKGLEAVMNGKVMQKLGKAGWGPEDINAWVKYLSDDIAEHTAAAAHFAAKPGLRIGKYSVEEVGKILDGAGLGPQLRKKARNMADLADELFANTDMLGRGLRGGVRLTEPGGLSRAYRKVVETTYESADLVERRFRANAIIELLQKGASPESAIKRMGRAFVNYDINSEVERLLRDVIPFAKFATHSTVWAKNIAENPSLVTWMARARGQVPEGEFLPERAEDSLALPLWWKDEAGNKAFLLGLGLPLEVTLNMLGAPTSARGFRRQILAGVHPVLRTPVEHATNRSFYFGDEWGVFRKPPSYLPKALSREITLPDGTKRYEIPGEVNEIVRSMPTSRLDSMVDKLFHAKRPAWDKALNLLTGARTMTVDQERELRLRLQDYLKDKARSGEVGETLIYFDRMDRTEMPEDLKLVLSTLKSIRDRKRRERKARSGLLPGLAR